MTTKLLNRSLADTVENHPPKLTTRSKAKSVAMRLTKAALATFSLLDSRPVRSRVWIGDAMPAGRPSFKANRRTELKARARRRGLRY
jgi:hypothetical protein